MADDINEVRSFGRYNAGRSRVYRPSNIGEVKQCFEIARAAKQRVTIRGGGHSFDAQALHEGDTGTQMILSTEAFEPERIEFDPKTRDRVTLGSGVRWRRFVTEAIQHARQNNIPICLPGSIQTGGDATVGGTLAADCLSRFSGTMGKESLWIDSFRILTPASDSPIDVSKTSDPDLFHAVIGGYGYIGFVTDVTYILRSIDKNSLEDNGSYKHVCAHTDATPYKSIGDVIQKQMQLIKSMPSYPRGVSSEWFGGTAADPGSIHGAVCDSCFAAPTPKRFGFPLGFPLYHKLHCRLRYWAEVAVRSPLGDFLVCWFLYLWAAIFRRFEDPVEDFLFFMDGDTAARRKFEKLHHPQLFPIVQQTFVVPVDKTETFTTNCIRRIREENVHPTECDMLFVLEDECLLSANYRLNGFALSFAFERPEDDGGPPERVFKLLRELSNDCLNAGGRIHLPKNSHVDREVFRSMFKGQIEKFENIKRQYDPDLLLQNRFSDRFFDFYGVQTFHTTS
jgi:decaprenylphospho-beta-D-ribofuranose 2-oxidase